MKKTIIEYYRTLTEHLHFYRIADQSSTDNDFYRMQPDYGSGSVRIMHFYGQFLIVIADFIPRRAFKKVSDITDDYFEISQFETDSSSFQIESHAVTRVAPGICRYVNTHKIVSAFCESNKPVRFTKLIITKTYFDSFLRSRCGKSYAALKNALRLSVRNPHTPELHFVFQQIKNSCTFDHTLHLYMESKAMEIVSLALDMGASGGSCKHALSVKLTTTDMRALYAAVDLMQRDVSAYPSIERLARQANMSVSRFQLAFHQVYGTTVYAYLKEMRMTRALVLLQNTNDKIYHVALKVGYRNAGHFSKLFKAAFALSPQEYRVRYHIYEKDKSLVCKMNISC